MPRPSLTASSMNLPRARIDFGKRNLLPSIRVEIRWSQPALECRFSLRPFRIKHREPRRVTIASFDNHVLTKNSLEREAQTQGRAARRLIQRVALPFIATVSQVFKNMASHQIHRLGRSDGPLQTRRIEDASNLDHAMRGLHTHVRSVPNCIARGLVDDGKE